MQNRERGGPRTWLEELSAFTQRIEEEEAMNPAAVVIWQCKTTDFAFGLPQT